jgi:polar amino acid transport system substrate-binding protein
MTLPRLMILPLTLWCLSLPARAETFVVVSDQWEGHTEAGGSGYYFEMMRALYEPLGHTLEFRILPYARAMESVQEGRVEITPSVDKGDLDDALLVLDLPVGSDSKDAFVMPDRFPRWNGVESLRGKRVLARLDYGFDQFLPADVQYEEKPNLPGMLKMLTAGRADAIIDYQEDIEVAASEALLPVTWTVKPGVLSTPLYAGFSNTDKGQRARGSSLNEPVALAVKARPSTFCEEARAARCRCPSSSQTPATVRPAGWAGQPA